MGRWQTDAQGRLSEAAMELYAERGFDATTVAEIAERAGLTKRTFFRHFADKREVLFQGSEQLTDLFVGSVAAAPGDAPPLDAVAVALDAVAEMFESRRGFARHRRDIIAGSPELQERELIKLAALGAAIAAALRDRGVAEPAATLAAETGVTVFHVTFERWVDPANAESFGTLVRDSMQALRAVTAATS